MKKNGFTLIELLAVIMIIAVIAVILIPSVTKNVEKTRENTFRSDVSSLIDIASADAAKNHYENLTYNISGHDVLRSDGTTVDSKGENLLYGTIKLTDNGAEAAIHNDRWCAIKRQNKNKLEITKYKGECSL